MDIKKLANLLVRKYDTRNPFEIIKGMNVILVPASLTGIKGFYQYYKRNNLIYLNDKLSETEQMVTLAHEMGHMLLHKGVNRIFMDTYTYIPTSKYEIEANTFAAELLIPDYDLLELQEYSMEQIARAMGYEERFVRLKL